MDVRVGLWRKLSAEELSLWTVVLEKTLESPLDCKEIQPVHSKGDLSWVFFGRNDARAEPPVLWPPHAKSWLIGKDPDAGRDWGQKEKRMTEDEMAGWHYRLNGHEFEWTPGVGDGQGGLACCDSRGRKESDMTERLNWTELITHVIYHMHACQVSLAISDSVTLWTRACQAPLSMGFSQQKYGVSCHALLQGIFPIRGCKLSLLPLISCNGRWALYH